VQFRGPTRPSAIIPERVNGLKGGRQGFSPSTTHLGGAKQLRKWALSGSGLAKDREFDVVGNRRRRKATCSSAVFRQQTLWVLGISRN
jgi:hypothetical protein